MLFTLNTILGVVFSKTFHAPTNSIDLSRQDKKEHDRRGSQSFINRSPQRFPSFHFSNTTTIATILPSTILFFHTPVKVVPCLSTTIFILSEARNRRLFPIDVPSHRLSMLVQTSSSKWTCHWIRRGRRKKKKEGGEKKREEASQSRFVEINSRSVPGSFQPLEGKAKQYEAIEWPEDFCSPFN